jgi:hypothetical protein
LTIVVHDEGGPSEGVPTKAGKQPTKAGHARSSVCC